MFSKVNGQMFIKMFWKALPSVIVIIIAWVELMYILDLRTVNYNLQCEMHGGHRYEDINICVDTEDRIIKW